MKYQCRDPECEIRPVCNPQPKRSVEFGDFLLFNQKLILLILLPRNEVCLGAEFQSVSTCMFSLCIRSEVHYLGVNKNEGHEGTDLMLPKGMNDVII